MDRKQDVENAKDVLLSLSLKKEVKSSVQESSVTFSDLKQEQKTTKDGVIFLKSDQNSSKTRRPLTLDLKDKKKPIYSPSHSPPTKACKSSGPHSLDFKTKKPQRLSPNDGPTSLDSAPKRGAKSPMSTSPIKKSPIKDRSPLSELFKSKTISTNSNISQVCNGSSIKDANKIMDKSSPERQIYERIISLEEKTTLKSQTDQQAVTKNLVINKISVNEDVMLSSEDEGCISAATRNSSMPHSHLNQDSGHKNAYNASHRERKQK